MNKNAVKRKSKASIKLEGNLSIYEAGEVREKVMEALEDVNLLEIDIKDIGECDTAGIQILCSAKITATGKGKRIIFTEIPKAVEDVMIKTGITSEMIFPDGGM